MARILVLEDNQSRIKSFRLNFLVGNNLKVVETSREAIAALSSEVWDWLFLDHDLGGQAFVESGPGTGYEVACFLEEHPDRKPAHIVIHSMNPAGGDKIQAALPEAKRFINAWCFDFETLEKHLDDPPALPDVSV
jgi:CheY-like chemotaxis protein